jgi:CheY-like chemotaxis protein
VAHDFNNILMAIGGSAELIATHPCLGSARAPQISTIIQAVQRAATLTQQLLAVGRKQSLVPRTADINEVLRGMAELLATTLGGHGGIELQLAEMPAMSFVDTAQLQNAILNLVINARDAMPDGGSVTIKTAHLDVHAPEPVAEGLVGSLVMISVSDTGTGMPENVRVRAFDPFFTTKTVGTGSGLGLSQVYGLVKQSGGETRIDSRVGQGTTVTIYLPTASRDPASPEKKQTAPFVPALTTSVPKSSHEGRRILVLDDDHQVLETVAGILCEAGYTVTAFEIASKALEEVNGFEPIDLMVVDFAMPDMRGDQFAAMARLRRPAVPNTFYLWLLRAIVSPFGTLCAQKAIQWGLVNRDNRGSDAHFGMTDLSAIGGRGNNGKSALYTDQSWAHAPTMPKGGLLRSSFGRIDASSFRVQHRASRRQYGLDGQRLCRGSGQGV